MKFESKHLVVLALALVAVIAIVLAVRAMRFREDMPQPTKNGVILHGK